MNTKLLIMPVIMLALVSAVFAGSEGLLVSDSSAVTSTLLYYEPVPAQPGNQVDIWIQIDNNGGGASKQAVVTIEDSAYIKPATEKDRVNEIPSIPPQQSFLLQLKVRISKEAHEGDHTIPLSVQQKGSSGATEGQLTINVQGTTSALSITSVTTDPNEIAPGDTGTITVDVKNVGSTLVRNVDVTLDFDDLDVAPLGSSNSKTINSLAGGEDHIFTFDVVAYPDAEAKAYKLPITLAYDDEQGNEKEQDETVGIVIGAEPELLVYFERVDITDNQGEVVVRFVNKGLAEIKLLEMEILESDDLEVLSESSVIYVGNIDEDDYESADVMLKISGSEVDMPLKISYKDALNKEYEDDLTLTLKVPEKEGGSGRSAVTWIVILVVAGVVVWWFFFRKKRRK